MDWPGLVAGGSRRPYHELVAKVTGTIRINASLGQVFDTAADSRNEPSFNPAMTQVELLTREPVGLGTRFRARMGKAGMDMVVELTEFDRPHRLGSVTTSSRMDTSGTLRFVADGDATLMTWDWQVHPKGWFGLLGPLVGPLGRRMERKIWTGLKRQLEDATPSHTAQLGQPRPEQEDGSSVQWSDDDGVKRRRRA